MTDTASSSHPRLIPRRRPNSYAGCWPLTELARMPHPNLSKVYWRTHLATWPVPAPCQATVRHPKFLIPGRSPATEDDRL